MHHQLPLQKWNKQTIKQRLFNYTSKYKMGQLNKNATKRWNCVPINNLVGGSVGGKTTNQHMSTFNKY